MRHRYKRLAGPLCAAMLLAACGAPRATAAPNVPNPSLSPPRAAVETTTGVVTPAPYDVPGEEGRGMVSGSVTTDGLEGRYYNDYLRSTLTLDGAGSFRLRENGATRSGHYAYSGNALMLDLGEERQPGTVDEDGDITLENRLGYYFHDFAFWGITDAEAGRVETGDFPLGLIDLGEGIYRYRDADNSVGVSFPAGMTVLANKLPGAVTVWDSRGSYVTGRNVTELRGTSSADSYEKFLEEYSRSLVQGSQGDYVKLYGETDSYGSLRFISDPEGSLAAAEFWVNGSVSSTLVRMLLYTSTYPDGTKELICKTVFAPTEERLLELRSAVTDLGAVRLVS